MFLDIPKSTQDLYDRLDDSLSKLDEEDKDLFMLELMKFCAEWQFMYLQMQYMDGLDSGVSSKGATSRAYSSKAPNLDTW